MGHTHTASVRLCGLAFGLSVSLTPALAMAAESASYRLLPGSAESRPHRLLSSSSFSLWERSPSFGVVSLASATFRIASALPPRFPVPEHPQEGWSAATGYVRNIAAIRQQMWARAAAARSIAPQAPAPAPPVVAPPQGVPGIAVPPPLPPNVTPPLRAGPEQKPGVPSAVPPGQEPMLHFAPEIQKREQRLQQRREEKKQSEEKRVEQRKVMEQRKEQKREIRANTPSPQKYQSPAAVRPIGRARLGMRFGAKLSSFLRESSTEGPFVAVAVTSLMSFALMFFLLRRRRCRNTRSP